MRRSALPKNRWAVWNFETSHHFLVKSWVSSYTLCSKKMVNPMRSVRCPTQAKLARVWERGREGSETGVLNFPHTASPKYSREVSRASRLSQCILDRFSSPYRTRNYDTMLAQYNASMYGTNRTLVAFDDGVQCGWWKATSLWRRREKHASRRTQLLVNRNLPSQST